MIRIDHIDTNDPGLLHAVGCVFFDDQSGRGERVGRVLAMNPLHHRGDLAGFAVRNKIVFSDAQRMQELPGDGKLLGHQVAGRGSRLKMEAPINCLPKISPMNFFVSPL